MTRKGGMAIIYRGIDYFHSQRLILSTTIRSWQRTSTTFLNVALLLFFFFFRKCIPTNLLHVLWPKIALPKHCCVSLQTHLWTIYRRIFWLLNYLFYTHTYTCPPKKKKSKEKKRREKNKENKEEKIENDLLHNVWIV